MSQQEHWRSPSLFCCSRLFCLLVLLLFALFLLASSRARPARSFYNNSATCTCNRTSATAAAIASPPARSACWAAARSTATPTNARSVSTDKGGWNRPAQGVSDRVNPRSAQSTSAGTPGQGDGGFAGRGKTTLIFQRRALDGYGQLNSSICWRTVRTTQSAGRAAAATRRRPEVAPRPGSADRPGPGRRGGPRLRVRGNAMPGETTIERPLGTPRGPFRRATCPLKSRRRRRRRRNTRIRRVDAEAASVGIGNRGCTSSSVVCRRGRTCCRGRPGARRRPLPRRDAGRGRRVAAGGRAVPPRCSSRTSAIRNASCRMLACSEPRSPMNLGAWTLTAYSGASALAVLRGVAAATARRRALAGGAGMDGVLTLVCDAAGVPLACCCPATPAFFLAPHPLPFGRKTPGWGRCSRPARSARGRGR